LPAVCGGLWDSEPTLLKTAGLRLGRYQSRDVCGRALPVPRRVQLVRRRTIAPGVLRTRVQLRVDVVVTEIPSRARLHQFTASSTPGEPGGHHGLEKGTGLAVTSTVSPRLSPIRR